MLFVWLRSADLVCSLKASYCGCPYPNRHLIISLTATYTKQAIYSDVDASSMHTKLADESYCVGGAASRDSYLRMDKIIEVAKACGAQVKGISSFVFTCLYCTTVNHPSLNWITLHCTVLFARKNFRIDSIWILIATLFHCTSFYIKLSIFRFIIMKPWKTSWRETTVTKSYNMRRNKFLFFL